MTVSDFKKMKKSRPRRSRKRPERTNPFGHWKKMKNKKKVKPSRPGPRLHKYGLMPSDDEECDRGAADTDSDDDQVWRQLDEERRLSGSQFKRDFYSPSRRSLAMDKGKVLSWTKRHDITITAGYSEYFDAPETKARGRDLPRPILKFDHVEWPNADDIASKLQSTFDKPTPIQSATWPLLLSGYNVIGIAKTGSGKTLAFLLPAIVHMRAQPKCDDAKVLIILPTRELAVQVEVEIHKFAKGVRHVCVYGGASEGPQLSKIRGGVEILVATPGRLNDFIGRKRVSLQKVTFVVWDEADRLLDMGFLKELSRIMEHIRRDKQMLMFSATWPAKVRKCAVRYLLENGRDDRNVVQVAVGSMDKFNANKDIEQRFVFMKSDDDKDAHLWSFLKKHRESKVLVFMDRKQRCRVYEERSNQRGYRATSIHGNKKQSAREKALSMFKSGKRNIMFATDVAGRGIHVDDIDFVLNCFMPADGFEDYIHRIGRTARAGRKGVAVSYFVPKFDSHLARKLVKVLESCGQHVPSELRTMKNTRTKRPRGFIKM